MEDIRVLSFHHRDPRQKRFDVSQGANRRVGLKTLFEEIAKCDVLCANCHLIVEDELRSLKKKMTPNSVATGRTSGDREGPKGTKYMRLST